MVERHSKSRSLCRCFQSETSSRLPIFTEAFEEHEPYTCAMHSIVSKYFCLGPRILLAHALDPKCLVLQSDRCTVCKAHIQLPALPNRGRSLNELPAKLGSPWACKHRSSGSAINANQLLQSVFGWTVRSARSRHNDCPGEPHPPHTACTVLLPCLS